MSFLRWPLIDRIASKQHASKGAGLLTYCGLRKEPFGRRILRQHSSSRYTFPEMQHRLRPALRPRSKSRVPCVRRSRMPGAHIHAGRIAFYGSVQEALYLGECDNLLELAPNLGALHPEDGTVEVNVLATGQSWMETRSDFKQAGHSTSDFHSPFARLCDPGEDLQESVFARSISANNADYSPRLT